MNKRRQVFASGVIALLVLAIGLWWITQQPSVRRRFATSASESAKKATDRRNSERAKIATDRLNKAVNDLSAAHDPSTSRSIFSELRKVLDSLPPDVASRVVQAFLKSGQDAGTKLDVTIKHGGDLGDASSLRVFLLDYLGHVDRAAAGNVAMEILSRYTTPDEWAVSLRNFAWANPDSGGFAYLQLKAREFLGNAEWRRNPSVGYLEAFDTIVYAHAVGLAPDLAALMRDKDNKATAHAAYLTLDRLTISDPKAMLTQLVEQPYLMQGREQTRANFVARADIRQPEQRALVEQYLLDPSRSQKELTTFAAIYPNANYMISDNLLTEVRTPTAKDLTASDREALKIVEEWENDPRFERVQPLLTQIHARLENFMQQADRGGR
jgi:hypothetical protein